MKKIGALAVVMVLLCLFGCQSIPIAEETTVEQTTVSETTTEETTTEESTTEEESQLPVVYSYTEIDRRFWYGYYSVNELAKLFGEPIKLTGRAAAASTYELSAAFKGIEFNLWDGNAEWGLLSYYDGLKYPETYEEFIERVVPTKADCALHLELYSVIVTGKDIPLPRDIKIGDSIEKVRVAYPASPMWELEDEVGVLRLLYRYLNKEDEAAYQQGYLYYAPYGIYYRFHEDILTQATITWINAFDRFD